MAANKRVSKRRGRRTSAHPNAIVESERGRTERRALMRADAVLRCVAVALEYDGWSSDEPDYAEAIGVARTLISQSMERLESHPASSTAGLGRSDRRGRHKPMR